MGQVFGLSYILVWELLFCLLDLCGFKQKNIDIFILCFCFPSAVITREIKEYFYLTAQNRGSQNMVHGLSHRLFQGVNEVEQCPSLNNHSMSLTFPVKVVLHEKSDQLNLKLK